MQGYLKLHENQEQCKLLANFLANNLGNTFLIRVEFGVADSGAKKFNVYKIQINSLSEGLSVCEFWDETFALNAKEVLTRLKLIENALLSDNLIQQKQREIEEMMAQPEVKQEDDATLNV